MSTGNPGFVSGAAYNPSGVYTSSFHKKEVGSAGQRIQLAPLGAPVTGKKHPFSPCIQDKEKCSFPMLPKVIPINLDLLALSKVFLKF